MSTLEFGRQIEQILEPLYAFALKLTRNEEEAKDLVQETAFRAYRNRDKFQPGTNFRAWTHTILRNTFINQYRRAQTRGPEPISVEQNLFWLENRAADGEASADLHYRELESILNQLDDTYRVPFLLFYRGYQYDEIAQAMNIPMGTVKSRIFYARKQLRHLVRAQYDPQR